MQKTNFEFEVVIGEDYGTDRTLELCQEYANKYSNVRLLPSLGKNIGITRNWKRVLAECKGEYIALCEGDDYWTDKNKLQKQVEFLDKHSDYTICYHYVRRKYEGIKGKEEIFPEKKIIANRDTITLEELLQCNVIQTNSVVYRNIFGKQISIDDIPDNIMICDWFIELLHAKYGKIGFIPEIMATYRRHNEAVWLKENRRKYWQETVRFIKSVKLLFADSPSLQKFECSEESAFRGVFDSCGGNDTFFFDDYVKRHPEDASTIISTFLRAYLETQNSHSYKLGYFLLAPFRLAKKLLKGNEQ